MHIFEKVNGVIHLIPQKKKSQTADCSTDGSTHRAPIAFPNRLDTLPGASDRWHQRPCAAATNFPVAT